jgi:hypothetical protein
VPSNRTYPLTGCNSRMALPIAVYGAFVAGHLIVS